MKRPKLFLVDGNSFFYRAYYAIPSLSNAKGEPTNAIYGFIVMMRKLIQDMNPDYLGICFDRPEPTFRHEKFKDYKAHRKPMPDDLVQQLAPIREYCKIAKLAAYEKAGFEADDILGTLACQGARDGYDVFIVTGDKDALQLINDQIKVLNPHKENMIFDAQKVKERFDGLGPEKVVEVMALMGDASDNIPGVRGIGEKTAIKLIQEFGSVENLLQNVDRIKSKAQQALLKDNSEAARSSLYLATMDTKVALNFQWEDMKLQPADEEKLMEFYKRYEFRGLLKGLMPMGESQDEHKREYSICTKEDFEKFVSELQKAEAFSFDTETTHEDPMRASLVGLSFCWKPMTAYYIPVTPSGDCNLSLAREEVLGVLKPILENSKQKKYGQNIKYDWIVMKRHGVTIRGIVFDTMIASYLANPLKLNHNLDDISLENLGVKKITTVSLLGTGKNQISMDQVPVEKVGPYACEDADCVFRLVPILDEKITEKKVKELFETMEMPLSEVLAKMEMNGVSLDLTYLKKLSDETGRDLAKLTQEICEAAGGEFNINSTKQLGEILFVKMGLPVIKRTKTGYSTDVGVLEKLAQNYELPKRILEYREKQKLKSTYLDALAEIVNPETKLVHTSYNQTTTATGRLSSSDPNLQNIPIKTEAGRLIRKAFVPRPDKKKRQLLSADYSQIELRILAHLSEDENLIRAFREDRDIHRFTATLLYGVTENDVTREMRNVAKTINFSIIYGKSAFGLAQDLSIPISEADTFIQNYFGRYRGVKDYLESQKEQAKKDGYLVTLFGRRSYFPEINSRNVQIRQFAERAAINAPIQGTAADLIKIAMIRIQNELESENYESLMIMQVHDELVFDAPEAETGRLKEMVMRQMEGAYAMNVPLRVDTYIGDSWYKN